MTIYLLYLTNVGHKIPLSYTVCDIAALIFLTGWKNVQKFFKIQKIQFY